MLKIQQPTTIIENKYNDLLISLIMVLIRKLKTKKKAYVIRRYVTSRKIKGPSHVIQNEFYKIFGTC